MSGNPLLERPLPLNSAVCQRPLPGNSFDSDDNEFIPKEKFKIHLCYEELDLIQQKWT